MGERGWRSSASKRKILRMRASDKKLGYYVGRVRREPVKGWKRKLERMGLKSGIRGDFAYSYYRGRKRRRAR
jgi:hypothetical protein